jgi:hypothetical protein
MPAALPRAADGRLVLAIDITSRLRPEAHATPAGAAPLPRWAVPAVAVLVMGATGVAAALLWRWVDGLSFVDVDKKPAAHLDVLKLAASIAVGGGGLFALYLAARRQRTQELELAQRERAHAHAVEVQAHAVRVAEFARLHAERVAEATERDAAARRVTELYSKSVEQLGSDKAAVRLGGLYALERLAQDNPVQRQTVVDVLCAYLRMPFEMPSKLPQADEVEYKTAVAEHLDRVQEREVRVAAQRILRDHLLKETRDTPLPTFWTDIDLDLRAATLIDFDLGGCTVGTADFESATFIDFADFSATTITGLAYFRSAKFTGQVDFEDMNFTGDVDFSWTTFNDGVPPQIVNLA